MSLFGCAASSNHRGQWCLTSPMERKRWRHNSVCLVCRENSWKVMTLVQGWENPMSLKWLRIEDLKASPFTSLRTGVTSRTPLAQAYAIRYKMQSPNTFLCGAAFHHSAHSPSCRHSGLWLCGCHRASPTGHSHASRGYWSPHEQLTVPI